MTLPAKIPKSRISRPDACIKSGYDRITIWIDQPLDKKHLGLPGDASVIEVYAQPMRYNPHWVRKIEVSHPTDAWLTHFVHNVARDCQVQLTYAELALDVLFCTSTQVQQFHAELLAHLQFTGRRAQVTSYHGTLYCGKRDEGDAHHKKSAHVVAVYADRPSKLETRHPCAKSGVCFHLEHRLAGSDSLADIGLRGAADLLYFDHVAYQARANQWRTLPGTTQLGKLLSGVNSNPNIGSPALRKRARQWRQRFELPQIGFCMHNALYDTPHVRKAVQRKPAEDFWSMVKATAKRIAANAPLHDD